ncbi:HAMP domain-containing histidine kinase [bacterium]|nr:HAMP domain-containing histidine kinase [bacterium]
MISKLNVYKFRAKFKLLLIILGGFFSIALVWYTQSLVNDLRKESRELLNFYAQTYILAATQDSNENLDFIFNSIIQKINIPIIYSDEDGNPSYWKNIEIAPEDTLKENLEKVETILQDFDKINQPIPLLYEGTALGYFHYGDTYLIKNLERLPFIALMAMGIYILIGFIGFTNIRQSEKQFLWVGLAKETAHQIGTPLSSLLGWIELIKSDLTNKEMIEISVKEMANDVQRLDLISQRFSQIGSQPTLKPALIGKIIEETVTYFQNRVPRMGKSVVVSYRASCNPTVDLNIGLFQWVLENLIKNAFDAIEEDKGFIKVELYENDVSIIIDIIDNGKGIENKFKTDIFNPGFSTKKRGWGLGLSLAKRIIEDYHKGKLFVKETKVNKGTTMRIVLNQKK